MLAGFLKCDWWAALLTEPPETITYFFQAAGGSLAMTVWDQLGPMRLLPGSAPGPNWPGLLPRYPPGWVQIVQKNKIDAVVSKYTPRWSVL